MMHTRSETHEKQGASHFMSELYSNVDGRALLTLWRKRSSTGVTEWHKVENLQQLIEQADRNSLDNWDCYFSVCPGRSDTPDAGKRNKRIKQADVACIPAYFMDIDVLTEDKTDHDKKHLPESIEDGLNGLQALPVPPSALVLSGRGLHAYWFLEQPLEPSKECAAQLKAFAAAVAFYTGWLSLDTHASEPARVLRIPGTKNYKDPYNPLDVELLYLEDGLRYQAEDLNAWSQTEMITEISNAVPVTLNSYEDDELISLCRKQAKSGEDFSRLFDQGSTGDHSAADYQLCRLLSYWTEDAAQIDRIFRRSALMREKWNREDYRQRTTGKAQSVVQTRRQSQNKGNSPTEDTEDSRPRLTYEEFDKVLQAKAIQIRMNMMSSEIEFTGLPKNFSSENAINTAPPFIRQEFLAPAYKGSDRQTVSEMITRCADVCRYNPVTDWLDSLQWNGRDVIQWLLDEVLYLDETDELSRKLVKKWLIQCVAMAYNGTTGRYYGADGVLTLQGAQGTGKTTFFERLTPNPDWFRGGVQIDMSVKDTQMNALSTWIAELGEVDSTLKKEQSQLKAFITTARDNIRAPYAAAAVNKARRTSFGATVNEEQYLRDTTGARRWWTVPVIAPISWNRLNGNALEQLWAQVHTLWRENPQGFRLDNEEQKQLAERNGLFENMLPGEDEVRQALIWEAPQQAWREISAGELKGKLMCQATTEQIGRVLSKLAKEDKRITLKRTSGKRLWLLPPVGMSPMESARRN